MATPKGKIAKLQQKRLNRRYIDIPGVPELPHDILILIAYSGVKIKTKIERKNVEGPIVSIL
jgi:hypothetical protein